MKYDKNTGGFGIVCDKISLAYKEKTVLKPQSFSMKPHEKILIQGPSGSGKTSFLHLISGLISPSTGDIIYSDTHESMATTSQFFSDFRRRNISITFADPIFFDTLSVEQNILFPHIFTGASYRDEWKKELISTFRIEDILGSQVYSLSSGEKDRLNITRALLYDRPILLLDEPGAHLDSVLFDKFLSLLHTYFQRVKPTTIIVSHSPRFGDLVNQKYICENTLLFHG